MAQNWNRYQLQLPHCHLGIMASWALLKMLQMMHKGDQTKSMQPKTAAWVPVRRSGRSLRSPWVLVSSLCQPRNGNRRGSGHLSTPYAQRVQEAQMTLRATAGNPGNPFQGTRVSQFTKHSTNPLWLPIPFPTHIIQRVEIPGYSDKELCKN